MQQQQQSAVQHDQLVEAIRRIVPELNRKILELGALYNVFYRTSRRSPH
jgi:metal-sulfur cluster biosynthetic enzyme